MAKKKRLDDLHAMRSRLNDQTAGTEDATLLADAEADAQLDNARDNRPDADLVGDDGISNNDKRRNQSGR